MNKRYRAFTLVELLVSLSVIAIAVTGALSVIVFSQRSLVQDSDMALAVNFTKNYFSRLSVSADLKKELFTAEEAGAIARSASFPVLAEPAVTNLSQRVRAIVTRKVQRWSPLLVHVGVEVLVTGKSGDQKRDLWFETTLSETYLKRLI